MSTRSDRARALAIRAHGDQEYAKGVPYIAHLREVATIMQWILSLPSMVFYNNAVAIAAAYLHDALEDTGLTYAEIERVVGRLVAILVASVTDSPGIIRHDRKKATYPKTRAHGPLAVGLKLADRLANVGQAVKENNAGMLRMYQKEQAAFAAALYRFEDGLDPVWQKLDGLLKSKLSPVLGEGVGNETRRGVDESAASMAPDASPSYSDDEE